MKRLLHLHAALFWLLTAGESARAQSISNASFEGNTFAVAPGYAADNGHSIAGWASSGSAGLNPAGGQSPFANNGAVPNGTNVAFLQVTGGTPATLSTTITGLTPGALYTVTFRANSRTGAPGSPFDLLSEWSLNGGDFQNFAAAPAVGGMNPYLTVGGGFIASSSSAVVVIRNRGATSDTSPMDSTLLVDDFSILPGGAWMVSPWRNNYNSGISSASLWAYHFGSGSTAVIGGKVVTGIAGGNPSAPGSFSLTGVPGVFHNTVNDVYGEGQGMDSEEVAKNFIYGGQPAILTLQGLVPGTRYIATLLSAGHTSLEAGEAVFTAGGQQRILEQNVFGVWGGFRVDYTFVADAPERVLTLAPLKPAPNAGFHFYGLALRETPSFVVTQSGDHGTGSLRQVVEDAAAIMGPQTVTFSPALSGAMITFGSAIIIHGESAVTIDASALPNGPILDGGPGDDRIFRITGGGELHLNTLSLTNGGGLDDHEGGAILNDHGIASLTRCALYHNAATDGGGGALCNGILGTMTLRHCTLSDNYASDGGGAICNVGTMVLEHTTVSGNRARDTGGGIFNGYRQYGGSLTLVNSIVAGNGFPQTFMSGADISNYEGQIFTNGNNIVGELVNVRDALVDGRAPLSPPFFPGRPGTHDPAPLRYPFLAPFGDYGGPTMTMALLPDSIARDASLGSNAITDQRGLPIVGVADIGAYEAGMPGLSSFYNAFIWETLPATASVAEHAAGFDYDHDGLLNIDEFNYLTNPLNSASTFAPVVVSTATHISITFPSVTGRTYTLQQNDTLSPDTWIPAPHAPVTGTGGGKTFTVPASAARLFFRITAGP